MHFIKYFPISEISGEIIKITKSSHHTPINPTIEQENNIKTNTRTVFSTRFLSLSISVRSPLPPILLSLSLSLLLPLCNKIHHPRFFSAAPLSLHPPPLCLSFSACGTNRRVPRDTPCRGLSRKKAVTT